MYRWPPVFPGQYDSMARVNRVVPIHLPAYQVGWMGYGDLGPPFFIRSQPRTLGNDTLLLSVSHPSLLSHSPGCFLYLVSVCVGGPLTIAAFPLSALEVKRGFGKGTNLAGISIWCLQHAPSRSVQHTSVLIGGQPRLS